MPPSHPSTSPLSSRRRFSLSSLTAISSSSSASSSSSSLRRLSTASSSSNDQPPVPATTIPFADPPYMPMFVSTITSAAPPAMTPSSANKETKTRRISTSMTSPASSSQSGSTSPAPSTPAQGTSRHSSRFFRRLHKRGHGKAGELDFGCVGEWNEGPSDLSSSYYDSHKSHHRNSSSSIENPAWTHSRGHSSSSSLSFSTAASSLPPSPTLSCDATLAPHPSRVPLSPRAASKKRQTEEQAAVEALNDYFVKVRLSQIEEDGPVHNTVTIGDSSYSAPPPRATTTTEPDRCCQGLAIFGATGPSASATKKMHDRSVSRDIEIEFIETGHTTFTPLSADSPSYSSAILLPEDAFFNPSSSYSPYDPNEGMCYDIDLGAGGGDDLSTSTCTGGEAASSAARTPIPEKEIGPALDELSTFFSSPPTDPSCSPVVVVDSRTLSSSSSRFVSPPSSPHLYSRSRRPDSFQAASLARYSNQAVRYDWI